MNFLNDWKRVTLNLRPNPKKEIGCVGSASPKNMLLTTGLTSHTVHALLAIYDTSTKCTGKCLACASFYHTWSIWITAELSTLNRAIKQYLYRVQRTADLYLKWGSNAEHLDVSALGGIDVFNTLLRVDMFIAFVTLTVVVCITINVNFISFARLYYGIGLVASLHWLSRIQSNG
jgi:hypothetical protein